MFSGITPPDSTVSQKSRVETGIMHITDRPHFPVSLDNLVLNLLANLHESILDTYRTQLLPKKVETASAPHRQALSFLD